MASCDEMDIVELQKWSFPDELPNDVSKVYPLLVEYAGIPEAELEAVLRQIVRAMVGDDEPPRICS